jgi:hypothetical protein
LGIRLQRISEQVEHGTAKGEEMECRVSERLGAFEVERDAACGGLGLLLLDDGLEHGPDGDRLAPHVRHTRERKIIFDHAVHAGELGLDGGEGFPQGSAGPERFRQEFDVQAQGLQRIANFMRHGGGQLTQDDQELGGCFAASSWARATVSRRILTTKSSSCSSRGLRLMSRGNSWPFLRRPARG